MEKSTNKNQPTWLAYGTSVQGALHKRRNVENQDAILWFPKIVKRPFSRVIVSVADGHGSPKSFRSSKGSQFAVESSKSEFTDFFRLERNFPKIGLEGIETLIKRQAEHEVPQNILRSWQKKVRNDFQNKPFSDKELNQLRDKISEKEIEKIKINFYIAYGTTLLSILISPSYIIYLQLGDGDIVTISENGEVVYPFPPDPRLFANETTSLCQENAISDIQIKVQMLESPYLVAPACILLSTDGLKNSFINDDAFQSFGKDIYEKIRNEGVENGFNHLRVNLDSWLEDITQGGSGDDITVGLLCRKNAFGVSIEKGEDSEKS